MTKPQTIREYMDSMVGFTTGFDYLRFILAIAVLVWHSCGHTQGLIAAGEIAQWGASYVTCWILPMFFALSGFLVTSSLERTPSIVKFLWLRFIRIYPALCVEVILSALVLGVLATTAPLSEYFTDPVFYRYFLNAAGYIHYQLPGVFETNPLSGILNVSLWTVPYELECYATLSAVALVKLHHRPRVLLSLFLALTMANTVSSFYIGHPNNHAANFGGRQLVAFFLAGVLVNLNRGSIPRHGGLAVLCAVLGGVAMYSDHFVRLAPLPVAYVTVWLGLLKPKKIPVLMGGDYSYGIYLYAGPMQQAAYYWSDFGKTYLGNVILALVAVSAFAAFSWHAIEKPALKLKRLF